MCLTLPKKVIEITGETVVVENMAGDRQALKSIVPLESGDYVLSQQNVIVEKISLEEAREIISTLESIGGENYED
jgi:hydrogenase maturation factor